MNSLIKQYTLTCASTLPSKVSKCISRETWHCMLLYLANQNFAGSWCTWCDARKSWFGVKDMLQGAVKWTCEKLREAKSIFDQRTARSNKNYKGVSSDQLLDVEPEDFIFPVLHVQMGIVNKALSHLVAWFEKHVEKLADGHAETRTNLFKAETDFEEAMEAYDAFVNGEPFLSLATKRKQAKTVTGDAKELLEEEIKGIEDEFKSLDDKKKDAKSKQTAARKKYSKMRSKRGKPDSSFAYILDKALELVGAKRGSYHGGDLQGNSSRTVMENSDDLFDELEKSIKDLTDGQMYTYSAGDFKHNERVQTNVHSSWVCIFSSPTDSSFRQ